METAEYVDLLASDAVDQKVRKSLHDRSAGVAMQLRVLMWIVSDPVSQKADVSDKPIAGPL